MEGVPVAAQLRVYRAPDDDELQDLPAPAVRVRLGDLLPLIAMAQRLNLVWLRDFMDDEVCITEDLHDVLMNFRGCRPA
jgi:hypothetical protein